MKIRFLPRSDALSSFLCYTHAHFPVIYPSSLSSSPLFFTSLVFHFLFLSQYTRTHTHTHTHTPPSHTHTHTHTHNTTDDSGVQGLIKFSATVLGPGDIQKIHDPVNEEKEAEEDLELSEGAGVVDAGDGSQQTLQFLVLGAAFTYYEFWMLSMLYW